MHGKNLFDRFQFEDYAIIDEKIDTITVVD